MENNTVRITFTFKIPEMIKQRAIEIHNQLLEEFNGYNKSEYPKYTPHVTIYQAEFPKENEIKVLRFLQDLTFVCREITLKPKGISVKNEYVGISFEKNSFIMSVHKSLVEKLNPLRESNIKDTYKKHIKNYSENEQKNIQDWGYPYVFDAYNPHMTLIALDDEKDTSKVADKIEWNDMFEMNCMEIVISKMGITTIKQYQICK